MYLKSVSIENVGPIAGLQIKLPFQDEFPLPTVLVGPNGSGKSTLLSFIVNALIGFKQQAFDEAEIENTRVYRFRSIMYIRTGQTWYHARLEFEQGLSLDEWQLDRPKNRFETEVRPLPNDPGWKQIKDDESDNFVLTPQPSHPLSRVLSKPIQRLFEENVVLYFPSDRFELPDWLNEQGMAAELRFPETVVVKGQTARRIFSRALLRPTLEWLKAVVLDSLLPPMMDRRIVNEVQRLFARIVDADADQIGFTFSHRNTGTIGASFIRLGRKETIPNLLGLSAGQAALFCLFSNVIRDYDLAGARFSSLSDIRGIVILDEADLHLHVDLQYRVFPELMKLFPKVQFIVTAHSPLFVMGMEKTFGPNGFRVIDMPTGTEIESEAFSEFNHALDAFTRTRAFDLKVLDQVRRSTRSVIIVEGKSDAIHIRAAWRMIRPGTTMPWDIVPCDAYSPRETAGGGAKMLRTLLHACCLHVERAVLALFDHDKEGVEQFNSLRKDGFKEEAEKTHLKHPDKPVHALLLPVPSRREMFVSGNERSCYLSLEHYYPDALLQRFGLIDEPVAADSSVYNITSNSKKKSQFARESTTFKEAEFERFNVLFDRLVKLLGSQVEYSDNLTPPVHSFGITALAPDGVYAQFPNCFHNPPIIVSATDSAAPSEPAIETADPREVHGGAGLNKETQN